MDDWRSFTANGGDSLAALEIASALADEYGADFDRVIESLLGPTAIAQLVDRVGVGADYGVERDSANPPTANSVPLPLLPEQAWFAQLVAPRMPAPHHWNDSALFKLSPQAGDDLLEGAWQFITARHPALRLTSAAPDGQSLGLEAVPFAVREITTSSLAESVADVESSLSITSGPLARCTLLTAGADRWLLLTAHHAAADSYSIKLLEKEIDQFLSKGEVRQHYASTDDYDAYCRGLADRASAEDVSREIEQYWAKLPWQDLEINQAPQGRGSAVRISGTIEPTLSSQVCVDRLIGAAASWHGYPATIGLVQSGRLGGIGQPAAPGVVGRIAMVGIVPVLSSNIHNEAGLVSNRPPRDGMAFNLVRFLGGEQIKEHIREQLVPRLSGININFFGRARAGYDASMISRIHHPARLSPLNPPAHRVEIVGGIDRSERFGFRVVGDGSVRESRLVELAEAVGRTLAADAATISITSDD